MGYCHGSDHANVEGCVAGEADGEGKHICYSLHGAEDFGSVDVGVSGVDWA